MRFHADPDPQPFVRVAEISRSVLIGSRSETLMMSMSDNFVVALLT